MTAHRKRLSGAARVAGALVLSVSAMTLLLLTPADARPGFGGGGHPNIAGHFGGGGGHFAGGGAHFNGGGPHPMPHPPHPHPGPHPPPPHPHPHPGPGPHPWPGPHPGPGPRPPGPRPPLPPPIPWVPGALVWGGIVTDDIIDDLIYTLPSSCKVVTVSGSQYEQCSGNRWYQVVMQGAQIAYIRVPDPR